MFVDRGRSIDMTPGRRSKPRKFWERLRMASPYPKLTQLKVKQVRLESGKTLPVYYLASYWPVRYGELAQQEDSVQLLRLKNGDAGAARHFASKLSAALEGAPKRHLIAMPSHGVGCASSSGGLRQVIRLVPGAVDLSDCLFRHTAVVKSSKAMPGQRPTAEAHRDSMRADRPERLKDLDVLLLDDVVTQGASMRGARWILATAGARSVTCLSLTRTE